MVLFFPQQTPFLPHLHKQNNLSSQMLPKKLNLIYLIYTQQNEVNEVIAWGDTHATEVVLFFVNEVKMRFFQWLVISD